MVMAADECDVDYDFFAFITAKSSEYKNIPAGTT